MRSQESLEPNERVDGFDPEAIRDQVTRINGSALFLNSERLRRFLSFAVEKTLAGEADQLKEYLFATEVFDRREDFDPRLSSIVRVEASKLRAKLEQYYSSEGVHDAIRIDIPKGTYVPVFRPRERSQVEPALPPAAPRELEPKQKRRRMVWTAAGWTAASLTAAALITVFAVLPRLRSTAPQGAGPGLSMLTTDAGMTMFPALSPANDLIAYASDRSGSGTLDIWLKRGDQEPVQLTHDEAEASEPAFSPDGKWIAYRSEREGGGIYVIPVEGGTGRLICRGGHNPRYSPDGSTLLYWVRDSQSDFGKVYIIPVQGGSPELIHPEFADAHFPVWAPDGKHILLCGTHPGFPLTKSHDWFVTPVAPGEVKKTGAREDFARLNLRRLTPYDLVPFGWAEDGIVFSAGYHDSGNIWRLRLNRKFVLDGEPQRLTSGSGFEIFPALGANHRLAFVSGMYRAELWDLPLDPGNGRAAGPLSAITHGTFSQDLFPTLTPDGQKLAFISARNKSRNSVWLQRMPASPAVDLHVTLPKPESYTRISPDGSRIALRAMGDHTQEIFVIDTEPIKIWRACENCGIPTSWSPDSKQLLFESGAYAPPIAVLDLPSGRKEDIVWHSTWGLRGARFSPDGHWIAFHANTGPGTMQIFIVPFRPGVRVEERDWIPVTENSYLNYNVEWASDGNLLYFISTRDNFPCVWAQRLETDTRRPAGPALAVQHFHKARHTLHRWKTANPGAAGPTAARGRLVVSLDDFLGNLWAGDLSTVRF